jgi:hypothetical protein
VEEEAAGTEAAAVFFIPLKGAAPEGGLGTELVGPPRAGFHEEEGQVPGAAQGMYQGPGGFFFCGVWAFFRRPAGAAFPCVPDKEVFPNFVPGQNSTGQGQVTFDDPPLPEKGAVKPGPPEALGKEDEAAGGLIQPVKGAGPVGKGRGQGGGEILPDQKVQAVPAVNRKAPGLVERQNPGVFVEDLTGRGRRGFPRGGGIRGAGAFRVLGEPLLPEPPDLDEGPFPYPEGRPRRKAVHQDLPLPEEAVKPGKGDVEALSEDPVKPAVIVIGGGP